MAPSKDVYELDVVGHASYSSTVYIVSSRIAKVTRETPLEKTKIDNKETKDEASGLGGS